MEQNPIPSPEEQTSPSFWKRTRIKWDDFIDGILAVIAIWGTLAIMAFFHPQIDEITHDKWWIELIFILIIFFICLITVFTLRPLIILAAIGGIIYLTFSVFTGDKKNKIVHNEINSQITTYINEHIEINRTYVPENKNDSLYKVIWTLKNENDSLKNSQVKDTIGIKN